MSYKLGLLLSVAFLVATFLFGADLILLNAMYQQVDGVALVVAQRIALDGVVGDKTIAYVESQGAKYVALTYESPAVGDAFTFAIEKAYTPIIMTKSAFNVRVVRTCIAGFYRPI